jgi:transposase
VIDMELLSVIRRWHYRDHFSIREISRRTGLSRNTVRKYLRSDTVEPKFNIPDRPSKLDPYADKLSQMLRQEAGKSRKQKRTCGSKAPRLRLGDLEARALGRARARLRDELDAELECNRGDAFDREAAAAGTSKRKSRRGGGGMGRLFD